MPLDLEHVTNDGVEARRLRRWPAKDLLVLIALDRLNVVIVDCLQSQGHILERVENLDAPASLELVHEGARQYSLARAVTNVNERAAWYIESVVPAVWILVLIRLLDPFEHLEERLEFDLTVRQADVLEALLVALPPTLRLRKRGKES